MRRDYFDANVRNGDDQRDCPVVAIDFDGPEGLLSGRLETDDGTFDGSDIDVTYRLTTAAGAEDPSGVLSVADRLTGAFVLETNLDPEAVYELVRAVKGMGGEDERRYRVRLVDTDGNATVYDKETLLVYDADGSLMRQQSLIPGGVEL